MSESEDRPRPQYGEYATPEEQRARIRQPDASPARDSGLPGDAPPAAPGTPLPPGGYHPQPPVAPGYPVVSEEAVARKRTADRIITFALLAYGLFNVVTTLSALLDFPRLATTYFDLMGISGTFTNVESGQLWGRIGFIILVAGYVLTVMISLRRLRAGKLTWWIPLVAGIVVQLVVGVCLAIPLVNDPAFQAYVFSIGS